MRHHPTLAVMLSKETTAPNPRQSAGALTQKAPEGAIDAVLYMDKFDGWTVLFVPTPSLLNLAQASRARVNGKPAVATAPLDRPLQEEEPTPTHSP